MTNIPEMLWFAIIYVLIGLLVQFFKPIKREMTREDFSIAISETLGEISATKAMIYRIAMVTLLALIWPLVIYWIAKDGWRGL
jgi:predicted histidine transporter YuiF (NhaC family)